MVSNILIIIICILLSILQLVVIHRLVRPTNFYLSVLHMFLIYPLIFTQLLPLFLDLLTLDIADNWDVTLVQAYVFNTLYYIFCLVIWRIFTNSYSEKYMDRDHTSITLIFTITLLAVSWNLFNLASIFKLIEPLTVALYPFGSFLNNFFKIAPFAILYGCIRFHKLSPAMTMFVYFSVLVYFVSVIPTGHRQSLISPFILLLFYVSRLSIPKKALISLLCLVSFAQVSDIYKSFRIIFSNDEFISTHEHVSSTFFEEVYFRFRVNNQISAEIADMINENPSPAGLEPLISSAGTIIPASLYDEGKPWPGSVDGTSGGILVRLAHQRAFQSGHNMSEYMYPLHPIWEMGYFYYFLNILVSAFGFLAIERFSQSFGDRMFFLPIVSMMPFTYSYVFSPIVIFLQQISYIFIPGLCILAFISAMKILGYIKIYRKNFN